MQPTSTAAGEATDTSGEMEPTATGASAETPTADGGTTGKSYGNVEIEPAGNTGGIAVVGWYEDLFSINPLFYNGIHPPLQLVFEGVIGYDPSSGEPMPLLATNWETSDDGLTWTFSLRDGVTFHDGEPFTADDVVYSYQSYMNPELAAFDREFIASVVAEIAAVDELTVEVVANGVNADFLDAMYFFIVAEHIYSQVPLAEMAQAPITTGEDPSMVTGTGPFRFAERVVGDNWIYAKHEGYWGGTPHLDEIVFQYTDDSSAVVAQLQTGALDIGGVGGVDVVGFEGTEVTVIEGLTREMSFLSFNLDESRAPILADLQVRQALIHGLDRQSLIEPVWFSYAEVAETLLPPSLWSCDPEGVTARYPYDPNLATRLLDEAGWTVGADGVREKDSQRLTIEFLASGSESTSPGFAIIQESWRQIGVELTPKFQQGSTTRELYNAHDFEICWWAQPYGSSGYDTLVWQCLCDSYPEGGNRMMYCNPEFDALMEEVAQELDREERIEMFTELQNIYLGDLPIIPLVFEQSLYGVSDRIHNVLVSTYLETFNAETWWVDA
jgi:peptide/nickel transport system substrate-binding protein